MKHLVVVDLGSGNLRSVGKAIEYVAPKANVQITRDYKSIDQADAVILPGQGAIGTWFAALEDDNLKTTLLAALKNKPILAICVGMQALFDYDEEDGGVVGLGVFPGRVVRFSSNVTDEHGAVMKVPQMGWNQLHVCKPHPLFNGIEQASWFYFLHSYYVKQSEANYVVGKSHYQSDYVSAVAKDNVFAIQCHPEKSHNNGLKLLTNFVNWKP